MDKTILIAILTKLTDRNPKLYTRLEISLPIVVVDDTPALTGDDRESAASKSKPISQVSETALRKRIKNILRPGRGQCDDSGSSFGVGPNID